jgi:pimeloyl-ACP methyl ester carboxylesterase
VRTRSSPRLFFTDAGSGEPVLLITGWTISSAVFDPIADLYLPRVRVVAYDHRGTGRSARWLGPVTPAMLAADAARVLDDRGIRSAHAVGLSMGAAVALELAVRMPSRVKSLVLVGGGAGGPTTVLPRLGHAASEIGAVAADTVRHRRLWPAAALFSKDFRDAHPERVAEYIVPFGEHRAPPWAVAWQTLAIACFARRSSLRRVRAPTLVLHGDQDVMSPPANAELLAREIPRAELHLVPGAGHAVPLERPEAIATLLLAWIDRQAREDPASVGAVDVIGERATRPFSLHASALRNTRDAARLGATALGRRRGR